MLKSNWYAHEGYLSFTGAKFLGYVKPYIDGFSIKYYVWFSEGGGGKDTPLVSYDSLKLAVDVVEDFFEQKVFDTQLDTFKKLLVGQHG